MLLASAKLRQEAHDAMNIKLDAAADQIEEKDRRLRLAEQRWDEATHHRGALETRLAETSRSRDVSRAAVPGADDGAKWSKTLKPKI